MLLDRQPLESDNASNTEQKKVEGRCAKSTVNSLSSRISSLIY